MRATVIARHVNIYCVPIADHACNARLMLAGRRFPIGRWYYPARLELSDRQALQQRNHARAALTRRLRLRYLQRRADPTWLQLEHRTGPTARRGGGGRERDARSENQHREPNGGIRASPHANEPLDAAHKLGNEIDIAYCNLVCQLG